MKHEPVTLGDKLSPLGRKRPGFSFGAWLRNTLCTVLNVSLLTTFSALLLWWFQMRPAIDRDLMLVVLPVLFTFWFFVYRRLRGTKLHYLLVNDRQGFMRDLRLDAKTALFDGSNIYHFGHDNGLDAQPLGEIAHQLRTQGYRIVCFFDANIFFILNEHGAFPSDQRHSLEMLEDIFGLTADEIYVVPSGVQADKYILESLKHLPVSFVVTNDQFRDYAKKYPTVMKDRHWRKGVAVSNNEIKLLQHRLRSPILIESDSHNRRQLVAAP